MKIGRLLLVLIPLLLVAITPVPAEAAFDLEVVSKDGDGYWIGNTWFIDLYPAETKTTTIHLYNPTRNTVHVDAQTFPTSQDKGNLVFIPNKIYFHLSSRSYSTVELTATASGSTTPGVYSAELVLSTWTTTNTSSNSSSSSCFHCPELDEPREPFRTYDETGVLKPPIVFYLHSEGQEEEILPSTGEEEEESRESPDWILISTSRDWYWYEYTILGLLVIIFTVLIFRKWRHQR